MKGGATFWTILHDKAALVRVQNVLIVNTCTKPRPRLIERSARRPAGDQSGHLGLCYLNLQAAKVCLGHVLYFVLHENRKIASGVIETRLRARWQHERE